MTPATHPKRFDRGGTADEVAYLTEVIAIQTEIASARVDLDAVLDVVTRRAQGLTDASGAMIEILDGDAMVYTTGTGAVEAFRGLRIPAGASLSGLCVRSDRVLRSDDTETDPRVAIEVCRRIKIRSMLLVPLRHEGRCVGVLKVIAPVPHHFNDRDVRSLELLSGLIGPAKAYAEEYQSRLRLLEERTKTLEALRESEKRLTQQFELTCRLNGELERANQRLGEMATTDALTGLKNRRYFDEALENASALMGRRGEPLAVILADVDHFKRYNDTYGHPAGDAVLRRVAAALRGQIRLHETVARYGGEEFGVILFGTDARQARIVGERLRSAVAGETWADRPVTASFGVATSRPGERDTAALLRRADEALYESKRLGRDRVSLYENDPEPDAGPFTTAAAVEAL